MIIYSKNNSPSGFYVYAYIRKDGSPYYIGKGSGKRAWAKSDRTVFPKSDFSNIVILENNLTDIGALAIERRMIRWYGRIDNGTGILRNKTDGGDGNSGWIPSEEVKKNISNSKIGKPIWTIDDKVKMSITRSGKGHWNYGRATPEDVSAKISAGVRKRNESRVLPVKTYLLIDIIDGIEIPFDCRNSLEILKPLGIDPKSLFWAKRYNKNGIYKNRYTVR
jgi:hypothetical protein